MSIHKEYSAMPTNIVITMAGRGSRFVKAGYQQPKYAIEAHGHSLFYWSMLSLKHFHHPDNNYIFVCLKENNSAAYVKQQCDALHLSNIHIVEIDELTDGQATSAFISQEFWNKDDPLLVYNIDTYVNPRCLHPQDIKPGSDAWVPCFQVPGDHWSFVKVGDDGWAVDCAEKTRISDFASIGLYWFSRADDYIDTYNEFFSNPANMVKGERYIAPMYRHYLDNDRKLSIIDLPVADVHVLGTPDELNIFLHKSEGEIR